MASGDEGAAEESALEEDVFALKSLEETEALLYLLGLAFLVGFMLSSYLEHVLNLLHEVVRGLQSWTFQKFSSHSKSSF